MLQRVGSACNRSQLPVNFALDVDDVEKHFDTRQLRGERQRREVENISQRQVGAALVGHVERGQLLVDDEEMQHGIPVDVLVVGIGLLRQHQPEAFFLAETRGEAERVLAPVHVALVVRDRIHAHRLPLLDIVSRSLLIFRRHERAAAPLVNVRARVEQELHHRRVLVDDGNVQDVLAVVLVAHVNVVDELRVEAQQTLGQVSVQRRGIQQAQMENRFTHCAALLSTTNGKSMNFSKQHFIETEFSVFLLFLWKNRFGKIVARLPLCPTPLPCMQTD